MDASEKLYAERSQDKRIFTVWFYLFEVLKNVKLICGNRKSEYSVGWQDEEVKITQEWAPREMCAVVKVLHFDRNVDSIATLICLNSWTLL